MGIKSLDIDPEKKFGLNSLKLCKHIRKINKKLKTSVSDDTIVLYIGVVKIIPNEQMIKRFIAATKDEWNKISESNINHFRENGDALFGFMGDDIVNVMKSVVSSDKLTDNDRNQFWLLIKVLVLNSIEYIGGNKYDSIKKSIYKSIGIKTNISNE